MYQCIRKLIIFVGHFNSVYREGMMHISRRTLGNKSVGLQSSVAHRLVSVTHTLLAVHSGCLFLVLFFPAQVIAELEVSYTNIPVFGFKSKQWNQTVMNP